MNRSLKTILIVCAILGTAAIIAFAVNAWSDKYDRNRIETSAQEQLWQQRTNKAIHRADSLASGMLIAQQESAAKDLVIAALENKVTQTDRNFRTFKHDIDKKQNHEIDSILIPVLDRLVERTRANP
jgi:hypothetical protein